VSASTTRVGPNVFQSSYSHHPDGYTSGLMLVNPHNRRHTWASTMALAASAVPPNSVICLSSAHCHHDTCCSCWYMQVGMLMPPTLLATMMDTLMGTTRERCPARALALCLSRASSSSPLSRWVESPNAREIYGSGVQRLSSIRFC
jgi:hypothetical protein